MKTSLHGWTCHAGLSVNGASASFRNACQVYRIIPKKGVQPFFPPQALVEVKALACELPYTYGIPLSRFSLNEIRQEVITRGIVSQIGRTTIWRWLNADAIRPWRYRSWIFPRDPEFEIKAARVLDLYEGIWDGMPLKNTDYVLSSDEKSSIQARIRKRPTLRPQPHKSSKVEHEYKRGGALNYFAAWDVRRAKIFGHVEPHRGIKPFDRFVAYVMKQEPYRSAGRVFWIVDNASYHRGQKAVKRMHKKWPNAIMVHLPVHASWLNQIEMYFSIIQRKVLTPNDSASLSEIGYRLLGFQNRYERAAKSFKWNFTRKDLAKFMKKLSGKSMPLKKAA